MAAPGGALQHTSQAAVMSPSLIADLQTTKHPNPLTSQPILVSGANPRFVGAGSGVPEVQVPMAGRGGALQYAGGGAAVISPAHIADLHSSFSSNTLQLQPFLCNGSGSGHNQIRELVAAGRGDYFRNGEVIHAHSSNPVLPPQSIDPGFLHTQGMFSPQGVPLLQLYPHTASLSPYYWGQFNTFCHSNNHIIDPRWSANHDRNLSSTNIHVNNTGMSGASHAHYYNLMAKEQLLTQRGTFQDLLRGVSSFGNQFDRTKGVFLSDAAGETVDELTNVASSGEEADDSESDIGDEEDYHDADDEDSEPVSDDDTEIVRIATENLDEIYPHRDLEFEFVPMVNGQIVTTKRRRRFPKDYEVPDSREPRGMGAIEKAMRIGRATPTTHIFEPKIGMVFDSRIEAYKFYNFYSWEVGFGVRFGSFAMNRVNKMRTMQKLVCERQGFDSRVQSRSKRCRCKAMIVLHRTEDMGWYVSRHVTTHNHELSVTCGEKREWNSHSKIAPPARKMIRFLRESNVSLTRVHCFMGKMYGGMEKIPFNQKSLRSVCAEIARDQRNDDIGKTMALFREMKVSDPGFQFSVDHDSERKVKTLIWASGRARSQYAFFGDAITFDTTYCTNIYNMPFGMFVGVNNHFQSILFAGVLMKSEDTESFKWVFKEFVTLMGGKAPVTILTDQCKAMTKAIKEVFTDLTMHLWCKWHVLRHAPQEIGPTYRNNLPFQKEFHYIINQMLTIDEFEKAWADVIKRYELEDNDFMKKTYAKRAKWAKPWSRGVFCARMASTQRSESANSVLKKIVPPHSSMNRFVKQYKKLEFLRTAAEQQAEHQTKQFVHRTKRMYAIEEHALNVYTKNCFALFSEEVDKSTKYVVRDGEQENSYLVIHNNPGSRKEWARVVFYVTVDEESGRYTCECGQYEHFGILCCHAIKVMISRGVQEIPETHIMKRWTRKARDFVFPDIMDESSVQELGQNLMFSQALDVVQSTDKNPKAEEILMRHLNNARKEIEAEQNDRAMEMEISTGYCTPKTGDVMFSETDGGDDTGYESNAISNIGNTYGASGSSAYMSDADIQNIVAPDVPENVGRRRVKRIKPLFERIRKGRKKYKASDEIMATIHEDKKKPKKTVKKGSKIVTTELMTPLHEGNKQKKSAVQKRGKNGG